MNTNLDEEEDEQLQKNDVCSQINLLSSIQFQQRELSRLAEQLQSEKDREKYIKVIEMSKIIQSKLDTLQEEKKRSEFDIRIAKTATNKHSMKKRPSVWSLHYSNSHRSSSSSSDNTTIRTSSSCGNDYMDSSIVFPDGHTSRYNTYCGHTYRVVDRVTSLQFQSDSVCSSRRSSADTILVDLIRDSSKRMYVKPATTASNTTSVLRRKSNRKHKRISFSPLPPETHTASTSESSHDKNDCKQEDNDEEEEEEEEGQKYAAKSVHIAIRKDASVIKIEKPTHNTKSPPVPPMSHTTINITSANSTVDTVKSAPASNTNMTTLPKKKLLLQDRKGQSHAGILTPPDSPQTKNQFDRQISSESYLDLNLHPRIIHVHKKTHQSLKGLLKRSYQLNQYTITKTNSFTPSSNYPQLMLLRAYNTQKDKAKFILKIIIVSLATSSIEKQRRFGFTFMAHQEHHRHHQQDDAKFTLAPDSLVKEALATWIDSQNEQCKETPVLPLLSKADEIVRDGRKLYIVYNTDLFPTI